MVRFGVGCGEVAWLKDMLLVGEVVRYNEDFHDKKVLVSLRGDGEVV